jgi:DDE superfamily endonuclease
MSSAGPTPTMRKKAALLTDLHEAVAQGEEIWVGDETTLREFPPLRSAWAKRGEQARVIITGKNPRRVLHTALHVATGELVSVVCERTRGTEVVTLVEALGALRPAGKKRLVWDHAPSHKPRIVRDALEAAGITIGWLPFRAPELNPCEDLFRVLKAHIAANRVYDSVTTLAEQAVAYLTALGADGRRTAAALTSTKYQWLPT